MIKICGANQNNLRNISLEIPRNRMVIITGVSGSGKSTLAYDVIFNEAQREFLDSMNSHSRSRIKQLSKSKVVSIEGLSPCVAIDQRPLAANQRSTVGTFTEAYTYLRLLFSALGEPKLTPGNFSFNLPEGACEVCKGIGIELTPDKNKLIDWNKSLSNGAIRHRNWAVGTRYWNIINSTGKFDMNKKLGDFSDLELTELLFSNEKVLTNSVQGYEQSYTYEGIFSKLTRKKRITLSDYSMEFFSYGICSNCNGSRINHRAQSVELFGETIPSLVSMEIRVLIEFILSINEKVVHEITNPLIKILTNLVDLGLEYLSLNRGISTLSNGEAQRVKLSRQLGSRFIEMIYILDEPTSGLHPKDIDNFIDICSQIKQKPNSIILVDHNIHVIRKADYIIELGPGAGEFGGEIISQGTVSDLCLAETATGQVLSNKMYRKKVKRSINQTDEFIKITDANLHNLKSINPIIPAKALTVISGVSGSGKSSLMDVILEQNANAICIDQRPIHNSSTSNPVKYMGLYKELIKEFSKFAGIDSSLLTTRGNGVCEKCKGLGFRLIDMHFLGNVQQECKECKGSGFKSEILKYRYKGLSISGVLKLTIEEAKNFFQSPKILRKLNHSVAVGLGYLRLNQPLSTLSGGESQRLKLANELSKVGEIYCLDEPCQGLHVKDIYRLLDILDEMVKKGTTIIVVEHNLDFILQADWVVDLGPEGGDSGGEIIVQGDLKTIMNCSKSYTGKYLKMKVDSSENILNGYKVE